MKNEINKNETKNTKEIGNSGKGKRKKNQKEK